MIHVLSKDTIDKIAAGEVVERPENIAKELIENAVDSGASSISVEIREGGISLIRVTDNGSGIAKEDIRLAFLRHATSKLKDASELMQIATMGFRGEALASICGVSEVELITKESGSLYGYRYEISGGEEKSFSEIGAPDGTTLIVRNLFYNVPARKKFLKSPAAEAAKVTNITEKAALSHPEISFQLISDGKNLLHTSGNGRLPDVVFTIYGREISENCLPLHREYDGILVEGLIGKPLVARNRRDYEIFFVNGRYIHSPILEKAVEDAFKPFMMVHRFPFALVRVDVDPGAVDVNVHPKKTEVRFSDGNAVFDAVYRAVSDTLGGRELIQNVIPGGGKAPVPTRGIGSVPVKKEKLAEPFEENRKSELSLGAGVAEEKAFYSFSPHHNPRSYSNTDFADGSKEQTSPALAPGRIHSGTQGTGQDGQGSALSAKQKKQVEPSSYEQKAAIDKPVQEELFQTERFLSANSVPRFQMIGQIFQTYWLIEFSDKLYIVDQHAAHEKVNYERLMRALQERTMESQMLLPPLRLTLTAMQLHAFQSYQDAFSALGYEMEEAGDRDVLVRSVPSNLFSVPTKELLEEIFDDLSNLHDGGKTTPDILLDRVATMSCKAAVKGNRPLSETEMKALIQELLTLKNPYACPHGRPTMISMSKYELDKKFKRIV